MDEWFFLLLHIVLSRLPLDLRSILEKRYGGDSASYIPPFRDLLRFLEEKCWQIENAAGTVDDLRVANRAVPRERWNPPGKSSPTP
ncbi:unnamed protein product [Parnassius apollo]|uniref:(apollo) hypothetical protein n=1 Tax=Parnassius apollo TaxID=110799 RepID=A0A8S3XJK6_PARAO|nr:unnamed protein product [Parnassius apollo]